MRITGNKQSMIKDILNMYVDEICKAVIDGKRVNIPRGGMIISFVSQQPFGGE